jgi:hypothetical protein
LLDPGSRFGRRKDQNEQKFASGTTGIPSINSTMVLEVLVIVAFSVAIAISSASEASASAGASASASSSGNSDSSYASANASSSASSGGSAFSKASASSSASSSGGNSHASASSYASASSSSSTGDDGKGDQKPTALPESPSPSPKVEENCVGAKQRCVISYGKFYSPYMKCCSGFSCTPKKFPRGNKELFCKKCAKTGASCSYTELPCCNPNEACVPQVGTDYTWKSVCQAPFQTPSQ